jgi:chloramphenicol O-acetyltransferase type A
MREIDLDAWARRAHFEKFKDWHDPWFNVCGNVDVGAMLAAVRRRGVRPTAAIVYAVARTANDIPEFRWRIRGDSVVEHDVVHPATTILVDGGLFSFCTFGYDEDFATFAEEYATRVDEVRERPTLEEEPGRDDLLFMTAIPWVSFTSFSHPSPTIPADCFPRFAWGRYVEQGGRVLMPLSVQGHHALVDGYHAGRYFERFQAYAADPGAWL